MIIPVKISYDRNDGHELSRETADVPQDVLAQAILKTSDYVTTK